MGETGEASAVDIAPLEQKIIQQIEYYFGDLNFPKDKFLQEEIKKDNGWITIETLCKFNRLKTLTTDVAVIAAAMRKSRNGIIEADEGGTKVRRLKALPENSLEYWQDVKSRTVYVKRFPDKVTLDELQEFFKKYANVERIFMRFYKTAEQRNFKGSVFATFPSREDAKKFVEIESVKYGEEELVRLLQEQYFKEKSEEAKRRKQEKKSKENGNQAKAEKEFQFTAGRVIRLTGIPTEGVKQEDIRALFSEIQNPEWVEFKTGEEQAFVRFENKANVAEDILKQTLQAKGKLTLGGNDVTMEVATGDVEKQYWQQAIKAMREARDQKAAGGRGQRGGGRGRGGKGDRRRNQRKPFSAKPQGKKTRFSSSSESEAEEKAKQELKPVKRPIQSEEAAGQKKPKHESVKTEVKTENATNEEQRNVKRPAAVEEEGTAGKKVKHESAKTEVE